MCDSMLVQFGCVSNTEPLFVLDGSKGNQQYVEGSPILRNTHLQFALCKLHCAVYNHVSSHAHALK